MRKFMQFHPFYEGDNGGGAGGAGGAGGGEPGDEGGKPEDKTPGAQEPEKLSLTQAEIDEMIEKRLGRERKKFEKYADYDELKTAAEQYKAQLEEKRLAEMTESEKAKEIAKQHELTAETLRTELASMQEKIKQKEITAAFAKAAAAANIEYIDDAFALANMSEVSVTDEGVQGIENVINSLIESKPFLLKTKAAQKQIGGASNAKPEGDGKSAQAMLAEAAAKAKATGRMEDKLAYVDLKAKLSQ